MGRCCSWQLLLQLLVPGSCNTTDELKTRQYLHMYLPVFTVRCNAARSIGQVPRRIGVEIVGWNRE